MLSNYTTWKHQQPQTLKPQKKPWMTTIIAPQLNRSGWRKLEIRDPFMFGLYSGSYGYQKPANKIFREIDFHLVESKSMGHPKDPVIQTFFRKRFRSPYFGGAVSRLSMAQLCARYGYQLLWRLTEGLTV